MIQFISGQILVVVQFGHGAACMVYGLACFVLFLVVLQEIFPGDPSFGFVFEVGSVGQSACNIVVVDFFPTKQIFVFLFGRYLPLCNRRRSHPCPSYLSGFFECQGDAKKSSQLVQSSDQTSFAFFGN